MDIMDELRIKFRSVKTLKIAVQLSGSVGRGDPRPVQIGLRGSELEVLNGIALDLADFIKQIPGTADVDISSEQSEPEIQVRPIPEKLGEMNVDAAAVGPLLRQARVLGDAPGRKRHSHPQGWRQRIVLRGTDTESGRGTGLFVQ